MELEKIEHNFEDNTWTIYTKDKRLLCRLKFGDWVRITFNSGVVIKYKVEGFEIGDDSAMLDGNKLKENNIWTAKWIDIDYIESMTLLTGDDIPDENKLHVAR